MCSYMTLHENFTSGRVNAAGNVHGCEDEGKGCVYMNENEERGIGGGGEGEWEAGRRGS